MSLVKAFSQGGEASVDGHDASPASSPPAAPPEPLAPEPPSMPPFPPFPPDAPAPASAPDDVAGSLLHPAKSEMKKAIITRRKSYLCISMARRVGRPKAGSALSTLSLRSDYLLPFAKQTRVDTFS